MKKVFILIALSILCSPAAFAQDASSDWQTIESKFFTIQYESDVNLRRAERRIHIRAIDLPGGKRYAASRDYAQNLANKFDLLFMKAQQILNMYPSGIRVNVKLFKRVSGLREEYKRIFSSPTNIISFYIFKYNTVYLSEDTIREGVVAHEFAHSIIDHYFTIMPPRKVQEILATYVDAHLKD